ncbi:MAG: SigB/SigF/SigG family RNA polymerase sigma factor [Solirubrobacterales bacterium]
MEQHVKGRTLEHEESLRLLAAVREGDNVAKERLFEANVGLIYLVLERFRGTRYEFEDLFQVGSIGLVKAIERFDPGYEVRFSTYAVPMIIGEIKRFLRDDGLLKVQRGLKEIHARVKWAQERLRVQTGEDPSVAEIASFLEIPAEDIVLAMEACQLPAYIHETLSNQELDRLEMIDTLVSEFSSDDFLEHMALREAMDKLDYREREIILRRFFKDETQVAIANDLGISQVQVSRMERAALRKLYAMLS